MLRFLRRLMFRLKPDLVRREEVECDDRGCPRTASLTKPLAHYIQLYEQSFQFMDALPGPGLGDPRYHWHARQAGNAYSNRVVATWGMIARGSEAVPYALAMLKSGNPDVREDGAGVLMGIGSRPGVVEELLNALDRETEAQSCDSIVLALGAMRDRRAIPSLARIIRQPDADGDTRWGAIESLERIVRRKFTTKPDAVREAVRWLDAHGL